ncbi:MAG TPA: thiamine pyrophosphate-dependent enzyme, partial [Bacillota bacterium]|nr:thiamine pyrophosphate-dependent enzyme [Bacillota bacterium]
SFYHDLNSLLIAKHYNLDVTIVLVNNDGGGIFSFLPQAENGKHFEELFGTPIGIDFRPAVEMYGGNFELAQSEKELIKKLTASYNRKGLSVIEVRTDRVENARWHRLLWGRINQDLWRVLTESEFSS